MGRGPLAATRAGRLSKQGHDEPGVSGAACGETGAGREHVNGATGDAAHGGALPRERAAPPVRGDGVPASRERAAPPARGVRVQTAGEAILRAARSTRDTTSPEADNVTRKRAAAVRRARSNSPSQPRASKRGGAAAPALKRARRPRRKS